MVSLCLGPQTAIAGPLRAPGGRHGRLDTLAVGGKYPCGDQGASAVPEFDIRDWMRKHNSTLLASDPAVRREVSALLRRDLNERLAVYAELSRQNQGRTERRNTDAPEHADAERV